MRTSFELKHYEPDGTYIGTFDTRSRISDVSYSFQLKGGQADCQIELALPWQDSTYAEGQFVKVLAFTKHHPAGKVVFSGSVNGITRTYSAGVEKISLRCLGLPFLFASVLFRSGSSLVFDKNQSCGQTVKDVVDYLATQYPGWVSYVPSEIEAWPNANIRSEYSRCVDIINKCAEISGFDWIVEPDGRVRFFSSASVFHSPALGETVQAVQAVEDSEASVNRYVLTWASWTVTVEDAASISAIGLREKRDSDTNILDVWTAAAKATAFVTANKSAKRKISVTLNGSYEFVDLAYWDDSGTWDDSEIWNDLDSTGWIEDVRPGDALTILNSAYEVSNLKIVRVQYNPEEIKIDLEGYDSFGKEVIS